MDGHILTDHRPQENILSLLDAAHGVLNATAPLPWLLTAGQPTAEQFATLAAAGLTHVIDIRESMEPRSCDEPDVVRTLHLRYRNTPVVSGALDDGVMDAVLAALRASRSDPTLLHCNSANRSGGPLIAYLMIDEGIEESRAVDIAMRSGLRSVEVLEWATQYAVRTITEKGAPPP